MTLLLVSFVAGLLTVLAPCTLPVLPIIIGGSIGGRVHHRLKPLIITGSLAASIVLFTLLLKVSTAFINIPQKTWAIISGLIIITIGAVFMFPELWEKVSLRFNFSGKSGQLLAKSAQKKTLTGDVLIGASLGPVFASCSPTYFLILATVLPENFFVGLVYLIAYALGLSSILLLVGYIGQRFVGKIAWATDPQGWFKQGLGALFFIVGIFILTGADKQLQAYLLERGLFDITQVELRLLKSTGME